MSVQQEAPSVIRFELGSKWFDGRVKERQHRRVHFGCLPVVYPEVCGFDFDLICFSFVSYVFYMERMGVSFTFPLSVPFLFFSREYPLQLYHTWHGVWRSGRGRARIYFLL